MSSKTSGPAPDNVVPAVQGNFQLKPVAFGIVLNNSRTFPGCLGAAVVLQHHVRSAGKLLGPLRHQDGVERLLHPYLVPPDHQHKVCDAGLIQPQLRLRSRRKVLHGANFDPKFAGPTEPCVELPQGLERAQHQGAQFLRLPFDNEPAASLSPGRILPTEQLQALVICVRIAVHHPDRPFCSHRLIHHHLPGRPVRQQFIALVLQGAVSRIIGNNRQLPPIPSVRPRPINLHVREGQRVQPAVICRLGSERLPQEVPERPTILPRFGLRGLSYPAPRRGKQIPHAVLFVVPVPCRRPGGILYLYHLLHAQRQRGKQLRYILQHDYAARAFLRKQRGFLPLFVTAFQGHEQDA